MASEDGTQKYFGVSDDVLILVLVEDGFRARYKLNCIYIENVLILVLVEDGFRAAQWMMERSHPMTS